MHFDRLHPVTALPTDGGWRADLALDRSASPPAPVLVVRVPPAVVGDALALSMLARGVDLASRVQHPGLRRLLGTGEVQGDLVLVEAWREGETLRGVVEAGGPLTPALASRVAIDLAGALHAAHTLPAALGRPFCHGAVRAERVLLAENGEVLLCGLGRPFAEDASPVDDLHGLARLLLECLPPVGAEGSGDLAAVLDRALEAEGYPTAAAFAEAVAAAVPPAGAAEVVARVEASQPEGKPSWLGRRRALEEALGAGETTLAGAIPPSPAPDRPSSPPPVPPLLDRAPASPDRRPPPFPGGPAPAAAPVGLPADLRDPVAGRDSASFVEVTPAAPPAGAATPAGQVPDPAAWFDHPHALQVVVAATGLLGLLLGFALGRR